MMGRRRNRPKPQGASCKNHPNQPAVRKGLCGNCLDWEAKGEAMRKNLAPPK